MITERTLSPQEIAKRHRVGVEKVINWIKKGELSAFDVGTVRGSQRPRFRVTESALENFEKNRTVVAPPPRARRRRRDTSIREYF